VALKGDVFRGVQAKVSTSTLKPRFFLPSSLLVQQGSSDTLRVQLSVKNSAAP
jgi:hypothetical protein